MASSIAMPKPTPTSAFTRLLRRYPLTAFFLLAYALTWPYMIVDALGSYGLLPYRLPVLLLSPMGYGPTFAALIVTGAISGKAGIRLLLRRLLIWRVGLSWYAIAMFGSIILSAIAVVVYAGLTGTPPVLPAVSAQILLTAPLLFLIGALLSPFAWLPDGITFLAVVLVVVIYGPAHLSRKSLSDWPTAPAGAARDGVRHIASSE